MEWLIIGVFIAVIAFGARALLRKSDDLMPPSAEPNVRPKARTRQSASQMRAIALEIISAEQAGGSHWDEGSAIAEKHGTTIWDVHDHYMAELERRDAAAERARTSVKKVLENQPQSPVDLRVTEGVNITIVGMSNWVERSEFDSYQNQEFYLRREPRNSHDPNAVAIYGGMRKIGYMSRAKAEKYAPFLDDVKNACVVNRNTESDRPSFLMPRMPDLRKRVASVGQDEAHPTEPVKRPEAPETA